MSRVTANDAIGLHLPSAALGVVIAWGVVPMHAIGEDPATTAAVDRKAIVLQQELQDVLDTLTRDREALRKRTVSTFELAEKRIGLLKLSSDDEVKLLEILRQEKARFEAHELLPFSAPMWTTTLSYLKARQEIDRKAEVAYARLLLKYERQEEPERVAAVKRTRDEMLNPSVVARWRHRTGGNPEGTVTCLSNGCIGSPDSTNKWTLSQSGKLKLHWPNAGAPGGVWIDDCQLVPNGLEYKGRNQEGSAALGRYENPPS